MRDIRARAGKGVWKGSRKRRKQRKEIFAMCEAVRAGDRVVADELERLAGGSRRVAWLGKHWRTINKKRFFSRSPTKQSWRAGKELRERLGLEDDRAFASIRRT